MTTLDESLLQTYEWRCIGPFRGGRATAAAGHPTEPLVSYFGACAGGVWKTEDGGMYWENVTDGFVGTASVGAIGISESSPNVVYVGMGETCIRSVATHGDGVYRSDDDGRTWTHLGLADTRHIAKVRVHPEDPDVVYVAALGHIFGPNRERGVYRTVNGGETWEQVLFRSEDSGAIDLSMDPNDPNVLYAAIWDVRRTPWDLVSGGPGSGLFKSVDGGDTWTELTAKLRMSEGVKGRIGVSASAAMPGRVFALVEAHDGALLRSDDGGDTWERVSDDQNLLVRPWYFTHVVADPLDGETVFALNERLWKSTDGGRTFALMPTPHADLHDLWIDPGNSDRVVLAGDGGGYVSFNGGATWPVITNQPIGQMYHVATDSQFPYRVYATQQDNGKAISIPSRTFKGAITNEDSYQSGTSENGYIVVRPDDPDVVYLGSSALGPSANGGMLFRYDHRTGQERAIGTWPEFYGALGVKDHRHRYQWTYPVALSPHNPDVLYAAGERVFRSTNEGTSWEAISPDLTRADESKMGPAGGPITKETITCEHYCTIFSFVESPHELGVLWAGSDDGLVHLSQDDGATWRDVTPPGMPEWATVNCIEVSPHDAATAYVVAFRYKLDDNRPYLYRTRDYGRTWREITEGIPGGEFTRVIREDPARRGLLYLGAEKGIYASLDDGESWRLLQLNLPVAPIHDLIVKDNDLVAATHGRSLWILDDLTLLHQLRDLDSYPAAHLFRPRAAHRILGTSVSAGRAATYGAGKNYRVPGGAAATYYDVDHPSFETVRVLLNAGKDPPNGVVVSYYLRDRPEGDVRLEFLDGEDRVIRSFSSTSETAGSDKLTTRLGANRIVWNMRYPSAQEVPGDLTTADMLAGPLALPGAYKVQLTVGGESYTQPFDILQDPRVATSPEELREQFELLMRIRDKLSDTNRAVNQARRIHSQVDGWVQWAEGRQGVGTALETAAMLKESLSAIEDELVQRGARTSQEVLYLPPKLNARMATLAGVVASADAAPTHQAYEHFEELSTQADEMLLRLQELTQTHLAEFSDEANKLGGSTIQA